MDSLRRCVGPSPLHNMARNSRAAPKKRQPTLRGRGDYSTEVHSVKNPLERVERKIDHLEKALVRNPLSKRDAAGTIGRTLGNFVGQGDLGALAGSSLAKYFGHGDYKLTSNSLMTGTSATGAKFSNSGRRGTRIQEREYLGDIVSGALTGSATDFDASAYILNPTNTDTFPWLSQIALLYDQWEPHGIVFEFVSTSSDYNGTSQALGAVIIATDYDSYDPPYTSKQQMENSDYACSTKPALSLVHGVECDPRERPTPILYTSTSNGAPTNSTLLGSTTVATQGCSVAGVTLGELWISYDITFYKKQLPNFTADFFCSGGTTFATGPYWPATANQVFRGITLKPIIGTGSRLNFNNLRSSSYLICYTMGVCTTTDESALTSGVSEFNCTVNPILTPSVPNYLAVQYYVTTTGPNAWVQTPVNAASDTYFHLTVTQTGEGFRYI